MFDVSATSQAPVMRPVIRRLAGAIIVSGTLIAGSGCGVEVGAGYPGAYYGDSPPDGYIATAEPVYYNGIANYWYGDRWYYRNGRSWASYGGGEPVYLRDYRVRSWPGGVHHASYHYSGGYHAGGGHRR
jgi:hypothetical protein